MKLCITRRLKKEMRDPDYLKEIVIAISRFYKKDWGDGEDVTEEDRKNNDKAYLAQKGQIYASYLTTKGTVAILTEWIGDEEPIMTVKFAEEI